MSTQRYNTESGSEARGRSTEYLGQYGVPMGADKTVMLGAQRKSTVFAWLVLVEGDPARIGTVYQLQDNVTSIGRSAENDIIVSDEAVSSQHAKIRIEDGKFVLYDLVTTNGTFVNGKRIVNQEIKENDEIRLAEKTVFVFKTIQRK